MDELTVTGQLRDQIISAAVAWKEARDRWHEEVGNQPKGDEALAACEKAEAAVYEAVEAYLDAGEQRVRCGAGD